MKQIPNLKRTEEAIAAYDKHAAEATEHWNEASTIKEVYTLLAQEERLGEAVGAAYGEDTKEFNNPATCKKEIRPGPAIPPEGYELSFVRRMVAKWKVENASKEK